MSDPVGILIVDKPVGITSHGVVGRVRKALGTRRVGHAGTLDPDATGVLVVGVGSATRLLGYLSASDKEYLSTFVLGRATTTDDAAGDTVSQVGAPGLDRARVESAMRMFVGDIMQRPSSVSAVKVDGKRAYDLVRAGQEIHLPARPVSVETFELIDLREEDRDGTPISLVTVRVVCSAGTYIRALARDLGEALGVGGHVESLRRTRSGAFSEHGAVPLADVAAGTALISLADAASRSLPWTEIDAQQAVLARNGVQIEWPHSAPAQLTAFVCGADLVGLGEWRQGRTVWAAVFSP